MASFNRVILAGNLTRDPEVRQTRGGTNVCAFDLAVNRSYTTQAGDKRDEVCYIGIVAWGKLGDLCAEYLAKGRNVLVEGHLQLDSWEKDGKKHYKHKVVAERVQFLWSKDEGGSGRAPSPEAGGQDDVPF